MAKVNPSLKAKKPTSIFSKDLEVDYKGLLKGIVKGISHGATGKWEEIANDTVETLSALGLATQPEELAFLLVNRSVIRAVFDLIGESPCRLMIDTTDNSDVVIEKLDSLMSREKFRLDSSFLDRPAEISIIKHLQELLQLWFEENSIDKPTTTAIVNRLPSYFVYALHQEWRRNAKTYLPLIEALNTPFTKASDRERAWKLYSALLKRRILEGIFDESFSLSQIYIPLNAYYLEEDKGNSSDEIARNKQKRKRVVVSLQQDLEQWLEKTDSLDTTRIISGGPGSGKSSFARIFAASIAHNGKQKVLFVPLHLIDATKDLVDEIGRFVRDEGILIQNPLDPESPEPNLLIIFDGLDELASQGKLAAETARSFIREVFRTAEKRNLQSIKLRVLISGRELVVQENESEFRRPHQILTLLPYFIPESDKTRFIPEPDEQHKEYYDPNNFLKDDLRQKWWKNYGLLTGKGYKGLPDELGRDDLDEVTAQPLLNYLVALSFAREKLDFTKDININSIYADLVSAVHERGYEKHRIYVPIQHMALHDFERVLEEIGLAAWHGDGRTTTVKEIEDHCRVSGVGKLLDTFREGAEAGVTRLLAAFFFRQYGQRPSGDQTFVFTHKSFGEYLTARRLVRTIEKVVRELERRTVDPDEGWDERDALKHWAQICGPTAISRYIHTFLFNEINLHQASDVVKWQSHFTKLFSYMLQHEMPMDQLQITPFKKAMFQSRNAEEAVLVALNTCARATQQVSQIEHPDPATFGAWFKKIQGQRTGGDSALAAYCLSFLNLEKIIVYIGDFYGADLRGGKLTDVRATLGNFMMANLNDAILVKAELLKTNFESAQLKKTNLKSAQLIQANFTRADLTRANLTGAHLTEANLGEANLTGATLKGANLAKANLAKANLAGADLTGANLAGANLAGAKLTRAKLTRAKLTEAKLEGTILAVTKSKRTKPKRTKPKTVKSPRIAPRLKKD